MKGRDRSANPGDVSTATASEASGEERSEPRDPSASRAFYTDTGLPSHLNATERGETV